jgi:FlaA1/EpsC-like NDP-sugar epimerase
MSAYLTRGLQVIVDLLALSIAYWLAFLFRFEFTIPANWLHVALLNWGYVVVLQYGILAALGVPRFSWRYVSLREIVRIGIALAASTAVLVTLRFTLENASDLHLFYLPLGVIAMNACLGFFSIVGVRASRRLQGEARERRRLAQNGESVRTLLIGAGEAGVKVAREIQARPDLGVFPCGFLDDDKLKVGTTIAGLPVLGTTDDLIRVAEYRRIKRALITIANAPGPQIRRIALRCADAGLDTKIIPGIFEIVGDRVNLSRIRDVAIEDLLGREPVNLDEAQVAESIRGRAVVVTGAGGSIGSELCRQVARFSPSRLVLVERFENALFEIHRELLASFPEVRLEPRVADVGDAVRMTQIFETGAPHVVFHAAAHKHVPMMEENPGEAVKNNIIGTRTVAELADRFGVDRFVLVSTDKAVNPTSVMGATKRVAEIVCQAYAKRSRTRFETVRFGNVLGSNGSVIPIFKDQIAKGGPVTITHPDMCRYFMTIPEAAQLVVQAGAMGTGGEIFILDMGKPVKIVDLAKDLITLSGFRPDEDIEIKFTGIRPGEKLFEELSTGAESADKTKHPKIFIGRVAAEPWDDIAAVIGELVVAANAADGAAIRAALCRLVPEYCPEGTGRPSAKMKAMAAEAMAAEAMAAEAAPEPAPAADTSATRRTGSSPVIAAITTALLVLYTHAGCGSCGKNHDVTAGSNTGSKPAATAVAGVLAHPDRSIKVAMWLGVPNNEILTDGTIDFIGQRASILVLNANETGPDPYFDYAAVVKRIKARYPELPVLFYDTALRVHDTKRVGGADFAKVARSPDWLLKGPDGQPVKLRGDRVLVDITNKDYQAYFPTAVIADVDRMATDGIAFDGFHHSLIRPRVTADLYQNGQDIANRWPAASEALLAGVKQALGKRLVIYNGLWTMWDGLLENQTALLPVADGASVEFFGYDAREPRTGRDGEFDRYVLQVAKVMAANPEKMFFVFGRTRRKTYSTYRQDYMVQRYDLASYLLAMTPLSTFKYHAHFQTISMPPDRADGLAYYADYDLDVGAPTGAMTEDGGVYTRAFTKGLVAVAPAWRADRTLRLDKPYYTPEGERREGELAMPAGSGVILLTERPTPPPARLVVDDFESGDPGEWHAPIRDEETKVVAEGKNHFVRVRSSDDPLLPYHDRRVQPVRRLDAYTKLELKVRTNDLAGAVMIRVEVDDATPPEDSAAQGSAPAAAGDDDDDDADDAPIPEVDDFTPPTPAERRPRQRPEPGVRRTPRVVPKAYAVVVVTPAGGSHRARKFGRDIPYGEIKARGRIDYVTAPTAYSADGTWQTVTVDAGAIFADLAPHLTARRISEVRLLGEADLDDIVLVR